MDLISEHIHWGWFTLAAILIIMEVVSPTFFFIWPGIAAACIGVLAIISPDMGLTPRLAVFAILTFVFAAGWKAYIKKYPTQSDDPNLNNRAAQLIGRTGIVIEAIKDGRGRVRVGDGAWIAEGPDCPEQTVVTIESAQSTTLRVRK
ncbi:MAG: NfeD family protein [Alphaproteobacteria bacterium]|nr:MAG: NfeD family protein [Alphaproteobacteria bacterium]